MNPTCLWLYTRFDYETGKPRGCQTPRDPGFVSGIGRKADGQFVAVFLDHEGAPRIQIDRKWFPIDAGTRAVHEWRCRGVQSKLTVKRGTECLRATHTSLLSPVDRFLGYGIDRPTSISSHFLLHFAYLINRRRQDGEFSPWRPPGRP